MIESYGSDYMAMRTKVVRNSTWALAFVDNIFEAHFGERYSELSDKQKKKIRKEIEKCDATKPLKWTLNNAFWTPDRSRLPKGHNSIQLELAITEANASTSSRSREHETAKAEMEEKIALQKQSPNTYFGASSDQQRCQILGDWVTASYGPNAGETMVRKYNRNDWAPAFFDESFAPFFGKTYKEIDRQEQGQIYDDLRRCENTKALYSYPLGQPFMMRTRHNVEMHRVVAFHNSDREKLKRASAGLPPHIKFKKLYPEYASMVASLPDFRRKIESLSDEQLCHQRAFDPQSDSLVPPQLIYARAARDMDRIRIYPKDITCFDVDSREPLFIEEIGIIVREKLIRRARDLNIPVMGINQAMLEGSFLPHHRDYGWVFAGMASPQLEAMPKEHLNRCMNGFEEIGIVRLNLMMQQCFYSFRSEAWSGEFGSTSDLPRGDYFGFDGVSPTDLRILSFAQARNLRFKLQGTTFMAFYNVGLEAPFENEATDRITSSDQWREYWSWNPFFNFYHLVNIDKEQFKNDKLDQLDYLLYRQFTKFRWLSNYGQNLMKAMNPKHMKVYSLDECPEVIDIYEKCDSSR